MKTRKKKRTWIILGTIAACFALLLLIGTILHGTYYQGKRNHIKPYGKMIEVNGSFMHLYSLGQGENTIVLLPGMGVGLPCADFGPLMRKLSERYTIVCVEYFGVGFSDGTTKERTCANYVEETRTALNKAGFKPPYVLMPHSVSGVYSEYYASTYPDEVKAIVSLDSTPTHYYGKMPSNIKWILTIAKFQQSIGVTSLLGSLIINRKILLASGYTDKELHDATIFAGFSINQTFLNQIVNSVEFIKQVKDLPFPESVPYMKIISRKTYETPNQQYHMTPQTYQQKHLERIGKHAQYVILEGNHFIYLNNVNRIAEITDQVLSDIKS